MRSGSEAGSYLRRIDFVYHSTLGLRVIQKKRRNPTPDLHHSRRNPTPELPTRVEPPHLSRRTVTNPVLVPGKRRINQARFRAYLRLIDSCITQLKAQGPSRTCNESKEEEEGFLGVWECSNREGSRLACNVGASTTGIPRS